MSPKEYMGGQIVRRGASVSAGADAALKQSASLLIIGRRVRGRKRKNF
jgi:hypothetical protein